MATITTIQLDVSEGDMNNACDAVLDLMNAAEEAGREIGGHSDETTLHMWSKQSGEPQPQKEVVPTLKFTVEKKER